MDKAKYHHQIPQTYLKAWGETVYVYYKDKIEIKPRSIENEFGVYYHYSIRPGDMFVRPESLDQFFSRLDPYSVVCVEKPDEEEREVEEIVLDTKEKLNNYWCEVGNWVINDKNGNPIPRAEKNRLITEISQEKDNYIEDSWSTEFENIWTDMIRIVKDRLWDIHEKKPKSLSYEDKQTLIEYYMMFDWRKPNGPKHVRELFDQIMSIFPDDFANRPWRQKEHPEDKTIGDAYWHMILNSSFYKLFKSDGMIKNQCDAYLKETTFLFFLDPKDRFITSDSPCFEHINADGEVEPLFVALPGLLIQLVKKDPDNPLEYRIIELTDDDVKRYNKIIFESGNRIISKDEQSLKDYAPVENEKAFAFYAYNLSLISTGLSPQEASVQAHQSFNGTSVISTIREKIGIEPAYTEMLNSTNPVPFYVPLMELLITDPLQDPTTVRNIRVRYVLTRAVIEGRISAEEILLHNTLFKKAVEDSSARADLDALWTRADPNMTLTNRLKRMYLERQKTKQAKT